MSSCNGNCSECGADCADRKPESLLAELNPNTDAVYTETKDSQAGQSYVNLFAVKPENENADFVKALEQCVYTQKVYDLIVERGFVPSFQVPAAE